jgi:hypothetical protein
MQKNTVEKKPKLFFALGKRFFLFQNKRKVTTDSVQTGKREKGKKTMIQL